MTPHRRRRLALRLYRYYRRYPDVLVAVTTSIPFLVAVTVLAVAWGAYERTTIRLPSVTPPPKIIYSAVATPLGCERLFGLQRVRSIVHSAYLYESPMLGSSAVDDIDCLLPAQAQETVTLPGYSTDGYVLRFVETIGGSGIASCWIIAAVGGHVCFLHLRRSNVGYTAPLSVPGGLASVPLYTPARQLSGDEVTAIIAMAEMPQLPPLPLSATRYHGGFVIGHSGWPSSYTFSNGSCGDDYTCSLYDAHLCVVLDQIAANWFLSILDGRHKRPPPAFHQKVWDAYLAPRHKKLISAYHKGKLVRAAQAWRKHQSSYRGVASKHYYGKTATRHDPYTLWRFRCGRIYVWAKAIKLQKATCLK
jgi:hypothetical protein